MILTTNLKKNKKYLLACSYGPDSMALFHYLVINNFDFEIVHVNYHILKQADDDEKGIKEEAKKYGIKVHVLSTYMPKNVNEEMWAREVRYDYFSKVGEELKIKDVLVAHNEGDLIETYLLQKERGTHLFYGLKYENIYKNVNIIRPLLGYKKDELMDYCIVNKIPFSIDPSNEDTRFKRNYFRQKLKALNEEEIEAIKQEIKKNNGVLQGFLKKCDFYIDKNIAKVFNEFVLNLSDKEFQIFLIYFLKKNNIFITISLSRAKDFKEKISNKKHFVISINETKNLYFEYNILGIFNTPKFYEFDLNSLDKNSLFQLNFNSKNIGLIESSKSYKIKPAYLAKNYHKSNMTMAVNREFISWKLPIHLRKVWPGIFDEDDNLIYMPRYQERPKKDEGLLFFDIKTLL